MLPKPKHSVTVGANKNRVFTKENNRTLVPHTLSRKTEKKNPIKENKIKDQDTGVGDDEDDDDDNDFSTGSFFSLGGTKKTTEVKEEISPIKTTESNKNLLFLRC